MMKSFSWIIPQYLLLLLSSSSSSSSMVVVAFGPTAVLRLGTIPTTHDEERRSIPTTRLMMETSNHHHQNDDDPSHTCGCEYNASDDPTTPIPLVRLGTTEWLLLQRHEMQQEGLRQDYGCTIKNDSYDVLRSAVWFLFDITNVIFPTLGLLLTIGLGLNLFCGLGYYYDTTSHTIIIDTLEHVRFHYYQVMN